MKKLKNIYKLVASCIAIVVGSVAIYQCSINASGNQVNGGGNQVNGGGNQVNGGGNQVNGDVDIHIGDKTTNTIFEAGPFIIHEGKNTVHLEGPIKNLYVDREANFKFHKTSLINVFTARAHEENNTTSIILQNLYTEKGNKGRGALGGARNGSVASCSMNSNSESVNSELVTSNAPEPSSLLLLLLGAGLLINRRSRE